MKKSVYFKIFVVLVILILIGEIILRIFYFEQLKSRITSTNRIPDSNFVFIRAPNTWEHYRTPEIDNKFRTNNQGYIGPDFTTQKKTDVFRIIFLGTSDVVGMHMNGTNNFTTVLQTLFNKYYNNIEVINCANEGGGKDYQHIQQIKQQILNFEPNLIVLENNGELTYSRYVYEGYRNYTLEYDPKIESSRNECIEIVDNLYKYRIITYIYDASYIIRAICKRYVDKNSNWDHDAICKTENKLEKYLYSYIKKDVKAFSEKFQVSWSYFLREYDYITLKMKDNNGQLVVFIFGDYDMEEKEFFYENNINFIELKFDNYSYLKLNSKLERHLNQTAHALLAERFFSQLILNNFIPKKYLKNHESDK